MGIGLTNWAFVRDPSARCGLPAILTAAALALALAAGHAAPAAPRDGADEPWRQASTIKYFDPLPR